MSEISDFMKRLSNDDLFLIYNNEYLKFKESGLELLPNGKIRELCKLNAKYLFNGRYDIDFAIKMFLEKWSSAFAELMHNKSI